LRPDHIANRRILDVVGISFHQNNQISQWAGQEMPRKKIDGKVESAQGKQDAQQHERRFSEKAFHDFFTLKQRPCARNTVSTPMRNVQVAAESLCLLELPANGLPYALYYFL